MSKVWTGELMGWVNTCSDLNWWDLSFMKVIHLCALLGTNLRHLLKYGKHFPWLQQLQKCKNSSFWDVMAAIKQIWVLSAISITLTQTAHFTRHFRVLLNLPSLGEGHERQKVTNNRLQLVCMQWRYVADYLSKIARPRKMKNAHFLCNVQKWRTVIILYFVLHTLSLLLFIAVFFLEFYEVFLFM